MRALPRTVLLTLSWASVTAHAALLVDTGNPPSTFGGFALYSDQSLGASFDVPVATVITSIEGFMGFQYGGTLSTVLYRGDPGGVPLFSRTEVVGVTFDPRWVRFDDLTWSVEPGTYTLTFETGTFQGYMPYPSPNSLDVEWNNHFGGGWNHLSGIDGLGIRVEVTAVPEPAAWLLMATGAVALVRRTPVLRKASAAD